MADNNVKSELRKTWETAAPGWAKWEQTVSSGLLEATDTLIEMAHIQPGMRVLDLACGAGSQTIQVARRVGANGRVVASDISATMLDHLRRNATQAGLENIEPLECAADDLDETQPPFDAAISRLALMLFPAPGSALQVVQHVLRPGARFAALVFSTAASNPFMAEPMAILLRHAGKSPPGPGQPGIFALGGDETLESLFKENGLIDIRTITVRASLRLHSASEVLVMMQEAFGAYRAVVADLREAEKSKAWGDVYGCLKQFEGSDGFRTELEFKIGSGAKGAL